MVKSAYFNESRVNESITFFLVQVKRNKGKVEEEDACIQVEVVNSVFTCRLTYQQKSAAHRQSQCTHAEKDKSVSYRNIWMPSYQPAVKWGEFSFSVTISIKEYQRKTFVMFQRFLVVKGGWVNSLKQENL